MILNHHHTTLQHENTNHLALATMPNDANSQNCQQKKNQQYGAYANSTYDRQPMKRQLSNHSGVADFKSEIQIFKNIMLPKNSYS